MTPKDLKYSDDHEWVKVLNEDENGDIYAYIGITDFAQSELGDLVYVEVDTLDETLEKGEVFGTVEAVKTTSDLFMPVEGTIVEFNEEIDENEGDNPAIINEDPYGKGWIVKIKLADPDQLTGLLDADAYEANIS